MFVTQNEYPICFDKGKIINTNYFYKNILNSTKFNSSRCRRKLGK